MILDQRGDPKVPSESSFHHGTAFLRDLVMIAQHPVKIEVAITEQELKLDQAIDSVRNDKAGAFSTFIGSTRDSHNGKQVVSLSYEAYTQMALRSLMQISTEIARKYSDIHGISVYHRIGDCPVGEYSVVIAVSATHRRSAIRGCEEIIDRLKEETPIWKKEVYADGSCSWKQNCDASRECG